VNWQLCRSTHSDCRSINTNTN